MGLAPGETAIHVLRMVFAGTFDKHPRLKVIIGHMGEMLPVMLRRIDESSANDVEHLKRSPSRTILDQVWITTSGIFSEPPFLAALTTFGIDRIMFSVDYPYAPNSMGRRVPRFDLDFARRHGEAHPQERGRVAEAQGEIARGAGGGQTMKKTLLIILAIVACAVAGALYVGHSAYRAIKDMVASGCVNGCVQGNNGGPLVKGSGVLKDRNQSRRAVHLFASMRPPTSSSIAPERRACR